MMPSVAVRITGQPARDHPRVTLTAGNLSLTLPITDREAEHDGLASEWVEIPRPGQQPLLRNAGPRLRTMSLDVIWKNYRASGGPVDHDLLVLADLSASETPIRVAYGPLEAGLWRLGGIAVRTIKRANRTNHSKLAEVRLQFVEAFDNTTKPPSARRPGREPAAAASPGRAAGGRGTTNPKTHVVRSGDTLSRIALEYCGNANHWPKIARENGIRNPHLIRPGQRLTIPC